MKVTTFRNLGILGAWLLFWLFGGITWLASSGLIGGAIIAGLIVATVLIVFGYPSSRALVVAVVIVLIAAIAMTLGFGGNMSSVPRETTVSTPTLTSDQMTQVSQIEAVQYAMTQTAVPFAITGTSVGGMPSSTPTAQNAGCGTHPGDSSVSLDMFLYPCPWTTGGTNTQTTPLIRDNPQSTGDNTTITYDLGVHMGEFGVVKAKWVTYRGQKSGNDRQCGVMLFGPGYHKNITVHQGRVEVYFLPQGANWTEWSQVLGDQATQTDNQIYGCPLLSRSEITVFFSAMVAPFNGP